MKSLKIQEFQVGQERMVILPIETWRKILELFEDLEDRRLYDEALADRDSRTVSHTELCRRIGRSPLRYLRKREGLTQAELANKAGLSQSFIAKVEANKKKLSDTARTKIARALGVPVVQLEY